MSTPTTSLSVLPTPRVLSFLERAEYLAAAGRLIEAETAFCEAIAIDEGFSARNRWGCFLLTADRCDEAIEQFCVIAFKAQLRGDLHAFAVASNNLAAAYRAAGCHSEAARWQQQSIKTESERSGSGAISTQADCDLANRANDAMQVRDYVLAEKLLSRSLVIGLASNSLSSIAADYGSLGVLAVMQNQGARAVACLKRAYELHRRIGDEHGIGCDLRNLAVLCERLGRWRAAVRFLDRALLRFESINATAMAAQTRAWREEMLRVAQVRERNVLLN